MQVTTLRPGIMVSLKTTLKGGVKYLKNTLEAEHIDETSGEQLARWETERVVTDPVEHELAKKARSKARALVSGVCANTSFGLLCPEADWERLENAIKEARKVVREFNDKSTVTKVQLFILNGRVAQDDVEAMRAINSEVRELMDQMERGIAKLEVESIRQAANRVKKIGTMLSPEAAEKVKSAVEAARTAARKISKAGENASRELNKFAVDRITNARTAFLDIDEHDSPEMTAPEAEGRAIDLTPVETSDSKPQTAVPLFEMD